MKKMLLLFLALPFLLGACSKVVPDREDSIQGRWVLLYAEKQRFYGTRPVITGYEDGVFYFYSNREAVYDDGYDLLQGQWQLHRVNDGYYDNNGH